MLLTDVRMISLDLLSHPRIVPTKDVGDGLRGLLHGLWRESRAPANVREAEQTIHLGAL